MVGGCARRLSGERATSSTILLPECAATGELVCVDATKSTDTQITKLSNGINMASEEVAGPHHARAEWLLRQG